jgi:excinuclease ABC subunit A
MEALDELKRAGNSIFVVEHDLDVMRRADWLVDVGPDAGERGGCVLYSGPPEGLKSVSASRTAPYLFPVGGAPRRVPRVPHGWLGLKGITLNNLHAVDARFPLDALTAVTGVSGSGKSSLVTQALVDLVLEQLGSEPVTLEPDGDMLEREDVVRASGQITSGMDRIRRLVQVDQKAIGRTPRSNLATYTGLFDHVRRLFAHTPAARARGFDAGRFSFNVAKGRCPTCEGEGFVSVELLFMPSVYAPCPACHGARFNEATLTVRWRDKTIAEVLSMTVDEALAFFADEDRVATPLRLLRDIGLGYLRLGQPATELSGGEAQRIKLATELQRAQRGDALYVLDEPTTGLHAADVDRLMAQFQHLVEAGNTVVVVEHDLRVIEVCDWVIDMGPGGGDAGGRVVAAGTPAAVSAERGSRTGTYLKRSLARVGNLA